MGAVPQTGVHPNCALNQVNCAQLRMDAESVPDAGYPSYLAVVRSCVVQRFFFAGVPPRLDFVTAFLLLELDLLAALVVDAFTRTGR